MGKSMTKVKLDVKCDRFVSLDTDLTVEQVKSMSESDIYEMFIKKFRQKAVNAYVEQMKDETFEFEIDFYYEEKTDG